jgi:hypothetical protein
MGFSLLSTKKILIMISNSPHPVSLTSKGNFSTATSNHTHTEIHKDKEDKARGRKRGSIIEKLESERERSNNITSMRLRKTFVELELHLLDVVGDVLVIDAPHVHRPLVRVLVLCLLGQRRGQGPVHDDSFQAHPLVFHPLVHPIFLWVLETQQSKKKKNHAAHPENPPSERERM